MGRKKNKINKNVIDFVTLSKVEMITYYKNITYGNDALIF